MADFRVGDRVVFRLAGPRIREPLVPPVRSGEVVEVPTILAGSPMPGWIGVVFDDLRATGIVSKGPAENFRHEVTGPFGTGETIETSPAESLERAVEAAVAVVGDVPEVGQGRE